MNFGPADKKPAAVETRSWESYTFETKIFNS